MFISIFPILLYLVIGSLAGLIGSLLGIGGGVLIVPSLLLIFSFSNFPPDYMMHTAIGTSLYAMVVNTFASTYFHHRKNSVVWGVVFRLILGIALGAIIGNLVAEKLSSNALQRIFGIFACLIGLTFFKPIKVPLETRKLPGFFVWTLIGTGVSSLANLLGLGGGFFMFPIFLHFHLTGQKAAGTSSATSFFISLGGAIGYLISANKDPVIPGCFGYVYLPAFLALSFSCVVASFFGVKIAHGLPLHRIRQIFASTLVSIGFLMIFMP